MNKSQLIIKLHNEGLSVKEISDRTGIQYRQVYNTLLQRGYEPRVTQKAGEKKERIKEMLRKGMSAIQIALELKVYPQYVYRIKSKMKKEGE